MTPLEIATAIRSRADYDEDIQVFVRRTMPEEKMADLVAAVDLLERWENAYEDVEALCDVLRSVEKRDATIDVLITAKRNLGYDPKLEALLARRWRCPHCKQFASIEKVQLPIGDPGRLPRCTICGEEGIAPVATEASMAVHDGGKSGLRPIT